MANVSLGLGLVLLAGVLNGSFAAPMKFASRWKWENIWTAWSVVALLLAPWVLVLATIAEPFSLYRNSGIEILLLLLGFGVGFGLSQILFGLGLAAVGLSLGFAITVGLSTAVGSLVPLVILQSHTLRTPKGMMILAGVGSILVGIALCAVAGREKEKAALSSANDKTTTPAKSFKVGLLICLLAGLGSPLVNFGLAFGTPLLSRAAQAGASLGSQANVLWAPLLSAALLPYLSYCFYLCSRNRTWHLFVLPGTASHWVLGTVMGLLWMTSVALYGTASAHMAAMGPILGWPLFMSVIIVTANVWGLMTGEWAGIGRGPIALMLVGILFLILGFCFVALGSRLA